MPIPERPLVPPALIRLWRSDDCLQLGLASPHPVVLQGLGLLEAQFLLGLDGRHDLRGCLAHAESLGLTANRAHELLTLLGNAGCLGDGATDAAPVASLSDPDRQRLAPDLAALSLLPPERDQGLPALARRRAGHVQVRGAGRVGAAVTSLLAAAGVGLVDVLDDQAVLATDVAPLGPLPDSVGRPRSDAAVEAALRTAPGLRRVPPQPRGRAAVPETAADPDLVVLTGRTVIDPSEADALLGMGVTHLPVTLIETSATVGPLVIPGAGPCLHCVDLHRADRDRSWPLMAAQLMTSTVSRPRGVAACDVVLATAAASLACLQVLAWIQTRSPTPEGPTPTTMGESGVAYTLSLPWGRPRKRRYTVHPQCGCGWAEAG